MLLLLKTSITSMPLILFVTFVHIIFDFGQ